MVAVKDTEHFRVICIIGCSIIVTLHNPIGDLTSSGRGHGDSERSAVVQKSRYFCRSILEGEKKGEPSRNKLYSIIIGNIDSQVNLMT